MQGVEIEERRAEGLVEAKALSDQDLQTRKSTLAQARADLESRQAAQDAVRVTAAAETTQAYLQACSNAEQGDVARRSADLPQQDYDITVRQRTLGAASDIEVQAQKQLLDAARAAVPTSTLNAPLRSTNWPC